MIDLCWQIYVSLTELHIICSTGRCRMDSVTEWQDIQLFGGERETQEIQRTKKVQPAFLDMEKRTAESILDAHWRAEWHRLNLQLKEWTCDHNTHITGHVYGGPVVRICRYTVHCFKCWACLPGRAAGFRGLHWQSYIRHREEVSFCVLAGSALYHQALKSTLGWVFDMEICLKWRLQWELIGKVSRDPQMCM